MKNLFILAFSLMALVQCSLHKSSSSDFSDSMWENPDDFATTDPDVDYSPISVSFTNTTTTNPTDTSYVSDTISYTIVAVNSEGIKKVVVTGSTFTKTFTRSESDTYSTIEIADNQRKICYNDTYTKANPEYKINIELHTCKGSVLSSDHKFDVIIPSLREITYDYPKTMPEKWTDDDVLTVTASSGGDFLKSAKALVHMEGTVSKTETVVNTDDSFTAKFKMSKLILAPTKGDPVSGIKLELTSQEGVVTDISL